MSVLFVSFLFAAGVWFLYDGLTRPPSVPRPQRPSKLAEFLSEAGLAVTPRSFLGWSVGVGLGAALLLQLFVGLPTVSTAGGLVFAGLPYLYWTRKRDQRRNALQEAIVEAISQVRTSIRAKFSLQESLSLLGTTGPELLRPHFQTLTRETRHLGSFPQALMRIRDELADPLFDQFAQALLTNERRGGSNIGVVLERLAASTQKELAERKEIRAQQASNVFSARIITIIPFAFLVLISRVNPEYVRFFYSPAGQVVLAGCAIWLVFVYWLMRRITRLPADRRVLRSAQREVCQ